MDIPAVFEEYFPKLNEIGILDSWGYLKSKEEYYKELDSSDVIISSANHEFFGVSIMEGVSRGCVPLCPNRLVYPELFSADTDKLFDGGCLYSTTGQLAKRLVNWIKRPSRLRRSMISIIQSNFENPNFLQHPEIIFGFHGKLKDEYQRLISS